MHERRLAYVTRRVREVMKGAGPFRPVAFYEKELDRLTVLVKDCSFTEHSRGTLVLLEDNHPEPQDDAFAGFAIEDFSEFLRHFNLDFKTATIEDVLAAVLESTRVEVETIEELRALAAKHNLVSWR